VKVVLIGYRCTGKSAAGRRLAERLGAAFVDTDERVEAEAGGTVAEIVRAEGWVGFRRRESSVLFHLKEEEACVVATGGGVVLDPRNREILKGLAWQSGWMPRRRPSSDGWTRMRGAAGEGRA